MSPQQGDQCDPLGTLKADLTALLKVGHDRGNQLRGVLVGASALQFRAARAEPAADGVVAIGHGYSR
jgi:hypothetical protein